MRVCFQILYSNLKLNAIKMMTIKKNGVYHNDEQILNKKNIGKMCSIQLAGNLEIQRNPDHVHDPTGDH